MTIVPKATGLTSAEEDTKCLGKLRTEVLVEGSSKCRAAGIKGALEGEQAETSSVDCSRSSAV